MANFRRIGILSSGGDAPGMNAAIRAATRRALSQGFEVVGILGGYSGLLGAADESDPDVVRQKYLRPFDSSSVSNIVTRGGTILYSSRCPEFATPEGMNKALRACEKYQIDAVIAIGGEDGLKVGTPYLEGASVTAKVMKNGKAKKITVFTYKPKKNEKRKMGHRQPYTKVQIESIQA